MPTKIVAAESLICPCEMKKPSPCLPTTSCGARQRHPAVAEGDAQAGEDCRPAATGRTARASVGAEPAPRVRAARARIGSKLPLTASWVLMMRAGKAAVRDDHLPASSMRRSRGRRSAHHAETAGCQRAQLERRRDDGARDRRQPGQRDAQRHAEADGDQHADAPALQRDEGVGRTALLRANGLAVERGEAGSRRRAGEGGTRDGRRPGTAVASHQANSSVAMAAAPS